MPSWFPFALAGAIVLVGLLVATALVRTNRRLGAESVLAHHEPQRSGYQQASHVRVSGRDD